MRNLSVILTLLSLLWGAAVKAVEPEPIRVIANSATPGLQLTRLQIRNIFMGSGSDAGLTPLALPPTDISRVVFTTRIIGLTESRVQSYWAQMRFSGRKTPPQEFATPTALLEHLLATPESIGYIPASIATPAGVQVLLEVH